MCVNDNLLELIASRFQLIEKIESQPLSDLASVSIGKTPPRKEAVWYTDGQVKWASIADLGKAGSFIFETKELVTEAAVAEKNMNTLDFGDFMLSFKLTVGRLGIATERMTTNEAIAQISDFKIPKWFLYSNLKTYKYQTLGSTSSIATAVNSKIIKNMPIELASDRDMQAFDAFAGPIFDLIYEQERQIKTLSEVRDELLKDLLDNA